MPCPSCGNTTNYCLDQQHDADEKEAAATRELMDRVRAAARARENNQLLNNLLDVFNICDKGFGR